MPARLLLTPDVPSFHPAIARLSAHPLCNSMAHCLTPCFVFVPLPVWDDHETADNAHIDVSAWQLVSGSLPSWCKLCRSSCQPCWSVQTVSLSGVALTTSAVSHFSVSICIRRRRTPP